MDTLVIYDEEEEYARNLMEYMSEKKNIPFKVMAFSKFEEIKKYAESGRIDILLACEALMERNFSELKAGRTLILSEGEMLAEDKEHATIYKYQSSEQILRELLNYYVEINRERGTPAVINGRSTEIIGVYSPVSRIGKTSFALTLGQILADEGPVLYINMEEFSGFGEILNKEYKSDLSDLMYYYKQSPESVSIKLQAIVNNLHGMDYVPPMIYSGDIRNVRSECWKNLICDIALTGMYNSIILDFSNMLSDIFDVMEVCDTIYMPLKDDRISHCKINEWEKFLLKTDREEVINKTIKVMPPRLPKMEWNDNYIEQLIWGEMGNFIRKIISDNAQAG